MLRMLLCAVIVSWSSLGFAQSWPTKPVRFILPFQPGGYPDIICRLYADKLSRMWGQPIIVENRGGANGIVGAQAAAKAPPDGYSLLFVSSTTMVVNPFIYKDLPYDPMKDFVPIVKVSISPLVLVVNPKVLPVNSVPELIAFAKKQPGKLSYASDSSRGFAGMLGEALATAGGFDAVHVPFKSTADQLRETVAGRTQFTFVGMTLLLPYLKSGQLRAIGQSGADRLPTLPDVPRMSESLRGFEYESWFILFAPTGTPAAVIQRVNRDAASLLADKDILAALGIGSIVPKPGTPESLTAFMREELAVWGKMVKDAKIEPE